MKNSHSRLWEFFVSFYWEENGAGEEIRTLDINLGKVALYH